MSLSHIVLGMLNMQAQSGFDLARQLENVIHFFWTTDQSQVYRTLYQLQEKGWVEHEEVVQLDNPNKKVYHLTPTGMRELKTWLARPGVDGPARNAFLAQVHFADFISIEEQIAVLEHRAVDVAESLALLEERAARGKLPTPLTAEALRPFPNGRHVLALDYGIRRFRFELEWLRDSIRVLKELNDGPGIAHSTQRAKKSRNSGPS
jgi:DNA-binding PadR family transcriptional regulator